MRFKENSLMKFEDVMKWREKFATWKRRLRKIKFQW